MQDEAGAKLLGEAPKQFFTRQFLSLFQELESMEVRLAILDWIILMGSGSMTKTPAGDKPLSNEFCICRTSQIMVSIALAMIRRTLDYFNQDKEVTTVKLFEFEVALN